MLPARTMHRFNGYEKGALKAGDTVVISGAARPMTLAPRILANWTAMQVAWAPTNWP